MAVIVPTAVRAPQGRHRWVHTAALPKA